ncbi:MAG: hypothetical protein IJ315_07290 [Firmicutes bacterium]|nr:hypothetical protein [Bacillota bacterium]
MTVEERIAWAKRQVSSADVINLRIIKLLSLRDRSCDDEFILEVGASEAEVVHRLRLMKGCGLVKNAGSWEDPIILCRDVLEGWLEEET